MTIEDVEDIQLALNELGIAMVLYQFTDDTVWTLHQRRLYEQATSVLNQERMRLNGDRSAA